jgi:hypothetical protein
VTCGANTVDTSPKQTASITLPSEFQAVNAGPSNGTLTGTAPNLTYTPNDDFVGDDSFTFTVNDGTASATVSITVLNTLVTPLVFHRTNYIHEDTILYSPSSLSAPLTISTLGLNTSIVQGYQTIIIKGDFSGYKYTIGGSLPVGPLQTMLFYAAVVQGTEYEMSFIYSVDIGNAKINLWTDAWDFGYKYIDHNDLGSHGDATQIEQTFTFTFRANTTKTDMRIDFQNFFTDATAKLTVKNFKVQKVPPPPTDQSVTCGANTNGITPKQTASITLPDGFQVNAGPSNGTLTGDAPNLTYTPTDGFVGDDSFTINNGTVEGTVSITVLPTLIFYKPNNILDDTTILYGPKNLSTPLKVSVLARYSESPIIQGNQTFLIKNPDTTTSVLLWPMTLYAPVVQGTEYEFSFIYSVNEGEADIQLYADAHPEWGTGYKWLKENLSRDNATPDEKTFSETFTATETKKMTIHLQTKFNVLGTTEQTLTIKNIIVQKVAAARKTKLKAPLVVSNGKALKDAAATVNTRNALKAEILSAGTDLVQKKSKRREALKTIFNNNVNLKQIPMTATELGLDNTLKENVVVCAADQTIDVDTVNSNDESFYCPMTNDGDEVTFTKGVGSFKGKRQDADGVEKHALLDLVNVASITKNGQDYTTAGAYDLVEQDVLIVTFSDGNSISFLIGSYQQVPGTASGGASGDPFLVTLL